MRLSDGSVYIGWWRNGKPHGHGVFTYGKASIYSRYDGEWAQGRRHGRGELTYVSGALFVGAFRDDAQSHGRLTFPNGVIYEGQWTGESFIGNKLTLIPSESAADSSSGKKKHHSDGKNPGKGKRSDELTSALAGTVTEELLLDTGDDRLLPVADVLPALDFVAPTGHAW